MKSTPSPSTWTWLALLCLLTLVTGTGAQPTAPPQPATTPARPATPKVPDGYTIELVAAAPLVAHPMFADFDEKGRLFIAEAAGKNLQRKELDVELPNYIRMLEDTDNDGIFDKSTIFADKLTFPQGVLCLDGSVYSASSGALWKFTDTDNDGVADRREKILGDFGYTGNAADVKGPFLGPDGRLYILEGRHGHHFKDKDGKTISKGKAGRIFSCKTDGSDVRSFCAGGFDNPVEIVFTDEGDMLGTVNLMHHQPRGDCLVHWVYGGVYPRTDFLDQLKGEFYFTGDPLPEVHNFGHVAVSGLCRYRSEHFGLDARSPTRQGAGQPADDDKGDPNAKRPAPSRAELMEDAGPLDASLTHLFITQFNTHKVVHTTLARSGSTYKAIKNEDFLTSDSIDFHPTDVLEDADGSLLVIDTGGWFRIGCPVSQVEKPHIKGAIWRVRKTGGKAYEDPRGLKLDWPDAKPDQLMKLMDDERFAVRDRSHLTFSSQFASMMESAEALLEVMQSPDAGIREAAEAKLDALMPKVKEYFNAMEGVELAMESPRARLASSGAGVRGGFFGPYAIMESIEPTASIRQARVASVSGAPHRRSVEPLLVILSEDSSAAVRRVAVTAIADCMIRPLNPIWARRVVHVRVDELVATLLQTLADAGNDRFFEHAVLYTIIQLADPQATAKGLTSDNERVRRGAAIALEQMRRKLTLTDDQPAGIEVPPPHVGTKLTKEELARLDALEPLIKTGDTARGKAVFFAQKASCAVCHRVGDQGAQVSLNLTKIGAIRSERDLLESILFPSATLARGFESFNITRKDGERATGLISSETADAIHLRSAGNQETIVPRDDIEKIEAGRLSIMPANYGELLSAQELADLIAYLRSLK